MVLIEFFPEYEYRAMAHFERRLADWLKSQAALDLAKASHHHAERLGVRFTSVLVRDTASRWGSCSASGALSYSWRVILGPPLGSHRPLCRYAPIEPGLGGVEPDDESLDAAGIMHVLLARLGESADPDSGLLTDRIRRPSRCRLHIDIRQVGSARSISLLSIA
jgi:hypothetical protein